MLKSQDGALPHRTIEVFELLDEHFSGRVLGLGYESRFASGLDWPPYSPDLNPCDILLWGNLKDKVYRDQPATLTDLQSAITREVKSIDLKTLKKVVGAFEDRVKNVNEYKGSHIEQYYY